MATGKKVFSFRCEGEQSDRIRAFARATGTTIDKMCETALAEYLINHPLPDEEARTIYEIELKRAARAREEK